MSRLAALVALVTAALIGAAACSTGLPEHSSADQLRIMVPNAPGGGYDTTARIAAKVIEEEGIAERPDIFNLEGASGAVGLARTVHERGNPDLMMMMGLGVVGALHTADTAVRLDQVTPIARLLSEPEVVMVRAGSRFTSVNDLLRGWRADPDRITVGGGSVTGGPDHLAAHLLAQAVGIDPAKVRYRQYDGGGPLLAALFTNRVDFAVSGVGENADQARAGAVRILAVTGSRRVPGLLAPTLREKGVDFRFANWRGLVAPPGLTAQQRGRLILLVTRMHASASWRETERANGWTDDFETGTKFGAFLSAQSQRVGELLARLGVEKGEHVFTP